MHTSSKKFGIVFDTNAYRELTYGKNTQQAKEYFQVIYKKEDIFGFQAFATPLVMLELLSKLADTNDPSYHYHKSAVSALFEHCRLRDIDEEQMAIIADSESLLCNSLYRQQLPIYERGRQGLAHLCKRVYESKNIEALSDIQHAFIKLSDSVKRKKEQFVEDMRSFVIQSLDPEATDWHPLKNNVLRRTKILKLINNDKYLRLAAVSQIFRTQLILNIHETNDEIERKAEFVYEHFKTPLMLYIEILRRIFTTGCNIDKPKRRNWIWDIQIAFCLGKGHFADDRTIVLVTKDKDIVNAAISAGIGDQVITTDKYIRILNEQHF